MPNPSLPDLQSLLPKIAAIFPGSGPLIAGGAVRDILNGAEVKDIDIFLKGGWVTRKQVTEIEQLLLSKEVINSQVNAQILANYQSGEKNPVNNVITFHPGYRFFPVQLIFCSNPLAKIQAFPDGLSQCWVSSSTLRMTRAYWADHFSKTWTFFPEHASITSQTRLEHLRDRYSRLRAKYPHLRFRNWSILNRDDWSF